MDPAAAEAPGLRTLALALAIALASSGAATAQVPRAGDLENVIRRRQADTERERQQEEMARRQPVIKELKDDRARSYVGEIVARIIRQTNLKDEEKEKVRHEILEWDIANAFVTPDFKVYVTTGLLEMVESDDELACVIGHELGHLTAKHMQGRAKQAMIWQGLMGLAMAFSRGRGTIMGSQLLGTLGLMRYGRKQELESDRLGIGYARAAGYDPSGMIQFMKKMGEKDGKMDDPLTTFLSTHPPAPQRVEQARKILKAEGLEESRVLKLSFNIKTDRSPVDLSQGIASTEPTTTVTAIPTNLLRNGKLASRGTTLPGWHAEPPGAVVRLEAGGVALTGTTTSVAAVLRADPVPIDAARAYLLRARYRSVDNADLRLAARFLDAQGRLAGQVATVARTRKGEEGRLGVDLGGAGRAIPPAAAKALVELFIAPGPRAAVELREIVLELASTKLPEVASNLVPNPGFEDVAPNTTIPRAWTITRGTGEVDRKVHAGGSAALRLTAKNNKEWAAMRSERIPIARGVDYLLSGQLRSAKGNQRMSLGLEFYREDGTTITTALIAAQGVFPPAEFTKYHGILFAAGGKVPVPSEAKTCAVVGMSGYYSNEPCWFDDIALIKVQSGVSR
jgi:Zn-dependent protease with chaperone function